MQHQNEIATNHNLLVFLFWWVWLITQHLNIQLINCIIL